jgi:protein-disulfide isomerase
LIPKSFTFIPLGAIRMSRHITQLSILVVIAALALGALLITRPAGLSEDQVRALVSEILAETTTEQPMLPAQVTTSTVDASTIHPMIESYLMSNPRILERVSVALRNEVEAEERAQATAAIASMRKEIYEDPDHVVLGNPEGTITLVEMFDYNCAYCRTAVPDLAALIQDNPELKVILKEFPILSQESVDAARIAVVVGKSDVDYWDFHTQLFTGRGKITKKSALAVAENLGLNPVTVEIDAMSEDVSRVLQRSYDIAQAVGTTGTPTYIIGSDVIPGAIGRADLQQRIDNIKACGKTNCDT